MSLSNKKVVLTGTLTIKRTEITKIIQEAGAKVIGAISKNVDILIAGADAKGTDKFQKAKELGIEIWDENKALAELKKGPGSGDKEEKSSKPKAPASSKKKAAPKRKASSNENDENDENEDDQAKVIEQKKKPKKGSTKKNVHSTNTSASSTKQISSEKNYYLESRSSSGGKFWKISVKGKNTTVSYGKIGSSGATTVKSYDSIEAAEKDYHKQIAAKLKKGYSLSLKPSEEEEEEEDQEENQEEDHIDEEKQEDDEESFDCYIIDIMNNEKLSEWFNTYSGFELNGVSRLDPEDYFGHDLTGEYECISFAWEGNGSNICLWIGSNRNKVEASSLNNDSPVVLVDSEGQNTIVARSLHDWLYYKASKSYDQVVKELGDESNPQDRKKYESSTRQVLRLINEKEPLGNADIGEENCEPPYLKRNLKKVKNFTPKSLEDSDE